MVTPEFGQQIERSPQGVIGTEFDFGGVKEIIVTRDDFSLERARQVLGGESLVILGYGVQGPAQSLNLRDNGFNVTVGQRPRGENHEKALADGWTPGRNLFDVEDAVRHARTIGRSMQVQYLLSDAGQSQVWPQLRPLLRPGDALLFSHGFSHVYRTLTGVVPSEDVDVILVAPKGAGRSLRDHFREGRGINSSFAVGQDFTGRARDRAIATGMAIGSGFLFPTTFEKEVYSDLTGERGVLLGAIYGLAEAAFNNLRQRALSPYEAANHSVEVAVETISRIVGARGGDGLVRELPDELLPYFANGFVAAVDATSDVFEELYESVRQGGETRKVLAANSRADYRAILDDELVRVSESELERAGALVRDRRGQAPMSDRVSLDVDAVMAGALMGLFHTQYNLFRNKGHDPSEAFNETVEEATQSLYPMISKWGIGGKDGMYANCSTTAQVGALNWHGRFRDALEGRLAPVYKQDLVPAGRIKEMISGSEIWKVGETVRQLRPERQRVS